MFFPLHNTEMSTVEIVQGHNGKPVRLFTQKCQYCGNKHTQYISNWSYIVDTNAIYTCSKCFSLQMDGFKRIPLKKDERSERSFVTYKTVARENAVLPKWEQKRMGRKKVAASRKQSIGDLLKEDLEIIKEDE